jgi:CRP-like cAMP-binding protein
MRRINARLAHLRAVPMFQTCNQKELSQLARLAEELPVKAEEVLVREGRIGHEFYILVSGKAEVSRGGKVVAVLGAGDHFGELALLDPHPRSATVTMTEAGSVLEINQREFWQLLTDVPVLPRKLLQGLARRLHEEPS